jgi:hypothetical protein
MPHILTSLQERKMQVPYLSSTGKIGAYATAAARDKEKNNIIELLRVARADERFIEEVISITSILGVLLTLIIIHVVAKPLRVTAR